jgi:hypothetical protein
MSKYKRNMRNCEAVFTVRHPQNHMVSHSKYTDSIYAIRGDLSAMSAIKSLPIVVIYCAKRDIEYVSLDIRPKQVHHFLSRWRCEIADDQLFVERRPQGDYAVRRPDSERASDVLPTQREAIERARELNPSRTPLVERVRDTTQGGRDKWRKP